MCCGSLVPGHGGLSSCSKRFEPLLEGGTMSNEIYPPERAALLAAQRTHISSRSLLLIK